MYLEAFLNKTVLLNLQMSFVAASPLFFGGQGHGSRVYARLRAVDELGIWVENPKWTATPAGGKPEEHVVVFQIPFSAILSVGVFPKRVFTDERRDEETPDGKIGFFLGGHEDPTK